MRHPLPKFSLLIALCLIPQQIWTQSAQASGQPSSSVPLQAKYFGKTKVDGKNRWVGLLTQPVPGEEGSYYGVVAEYLNPLHEKGFIAEFVRPGKSKPFSKLKNGYLQELFHWVTIVKMVPKTNSSQTLSYELRPVQVSNGKIHEAGVASVGTFTPTGKKFLTGEQGTLTLEVLGETREFHFRGQRRFPLKSTWETQFSAGPYNPGYKQAEKTILTIHNNANAETRSSKLTFAVDELKGIPLSIHGDYQMNHLGSGLYTFSELESGAFNSKHRIEGFHLIEDKIGVFIDVYDAKPIMKTVEFILIDPTNPKNSQMYFELYGNKTLTKQIP
jgi:hypothetical protein